MSYDLPLILAWLGLAVCLLSVLLLSASEATLASTNRIRLRQLLRTQAADDQQGAAPHEFSLEAQRFVATIATAADASLIGAGALTTWLAWHSSYTGLRCLAVCAGVAVLVVTTLQVTPRLLASRVTASRELAWIHLARLFVKLWRPPVAVMVRLARALLTAAGLAEANKPPRPTSPADDAAAILEMVESARASGVLEDSGHELIESIFTFGDTRVDDVMVPRPDIQALPLNSPPALMLDKFQQTGFSRLPLFEDNVDRIAGVLHVKDVLKTLTAPDAWSPRDLMRPPLFIPESQKIDEALALMRARKSHLALVMDEFGGTAGLLTIEDILEELVGDIADEHDPHGDEALVVLDGDRVLVDAAMHADDLKEQWSLSLPVGEYETVGGFMIEQLGRALVVGDQLQLPTCLLTVHSMHKRRPGKILLQRREPADLEEENS